MFFEHHKMPIGQGSATGGQSMVDASLGQGKVVKIPFNDYGGTGLSDGPQGQVDTE